MKNILIAISLTMLSLNAQVSTIPEIAASTNETEVVSIPVLQAYIAQRDSEQVSAVAAQTTLDLAELNRVKANYLVDRNGLISDNTAALATKDSIIATKSTDLASATATIASNTTAITALEATVSNQVSTIAARDATITSNAIALAAVTKERDDVVKLRDDSAAAYVAIRDGLLASTELPQEIKDFIMSKVTPLEQFVVIAKTPAEQLRLKQLEDDAAAKAKAKEDLEATIAAQQAEIAALKAKLGL